MGGCFLDFLALEQGSLVPVCFGICLGVSLAARKGVSKRMGFQNGKFSVKKNREETKRP